MPTFTYNCYKQAQSIEDVKDQLSALDRELQGTDMHNLIAFNHTYYIITKNVYNKLCSGYFKDDTLMQRIDTYFGNYYFDALNNYIHRNDCAPAWRILFDACRKDRNFQFIYMALGVNAHVNNDLPQTLQEALKGSEQADDYNRINTIISYSLNEVIESLHEKNKIISVSEKMFKNIYKHYLTYIIHKWRKRAWKNYLELQNHTITKEIVELDAKGKANILVEIEQLHDTFRVIKIN